MNLTTLRRLVLVGNIAAFGAAGAAAWHAFDSRPVPRDEKEWPKIFPVKPTATLDANNGLPPQPEFIAAVNWSQGEKPKPVTPDEKIDVPKVDPFKSKYRLNCVFVAEQKQESYAQLALTASGSAGFSVRVGEKIPEDPADRGSPKCTPWRLEDVTAASAEGSGKSTARFLNVDTEEEIVLELVTGMPGGSFVGTKTPTGGGDARQWQTARADGRPDENQPSRVIRLRADKVKGEYEFEFPDEEWDWLGEYGEKEIGKFATVAYKDGSGNPDGFTLKSVPPGSRLADLGFKAEDRVISVNGEKVNTTEQAVSVGKRQYEGGKNTFALKFLRAGKEVNYTFHAKKKKSGN
jgi:hypothetical protein